MTRPERRTQAKIDLFEQAKGECFEGLPPLAA